jgi:drug/metabolite transporter (DMT)-like permease
MSSHGAGQAMSREDMAVLLLLTLLWGGSFFFQQVALRSIAPLTLVLGRTALAAGLLWLFLWLRGTRLPLPPGAASAYLVLALLNNVIPWILFVHAQTQISGGLASIFNATTPIWGILVAHVLTADEKATPGKIAGVLLGFAGVGLMFIGRLQGGGDLLAELECLGATLAYALAGIWARRFRAMGIDPVAVATGQLTGAALVMLPLVLLFEPPWHAAMPTPAAWASLIALATVSTSLGYALYFRLIASAGATNALLVTLLIPIPAILLGALVLGDVLAPRHFAGMALIAAGLVAIDGRLLRRRRHSERVIPAE